MANLILPDSESLGRKRFPDNKEFRKQLYARSNVILASLLDLLPSNYSADTSTNLAVLYRILARESARIRLSGEAITNDGIYTQTRIQYLQQILGERLFLGDRIAPVSYNDEAFRNYVLKIKDAYLKGSTISNIEAFISSFTGQTVNIKELYKEARKPNSSYGVVDGNKMIIEMLIGDEGQQNLSILLNNLKFFVDLIRPAHVLYDTRLIWTETINVNKIHDIIYGDTGGGCIPVYDIIPFVTRTVLALKVFVSGLPQPGTSGRIASIHQDDYVFYLDDGTLVITDPDPVNGTQIYDISNKRVTINDLRIGDYVQLLFLEIPGDFQFWWLSSYLGTGYSRFYLDNLRSPVFQEFVKKEMDSQGRFPLQIRSTPTTVCDRWVQDALQPLYEDLRSTCQDRPIITKTYDITLSDRMAYPRLSWPSPITDSYLLGNPYAFALYGIPLTDGSGHAADTTDISVIFDGTALTGAISSVDASSGRIYINDSTAFWDSSAHIPTAGDVFQFGYYYSPDGTDRTAAEAKIFGISAWQMPSVPMVDSSGDLVTTVSLAIDGTSITGAVSSVEPLLGHVRLNDSTSFWNSSELGRYPVIGDEFRFQYRYGGGVQYASIFDDPERVMDSIEPLTMVFDGYDGTNSFVASEPIEIGYRYRAYLLHHTSVLNSPDTLLLNNFQKPATRASIINQQDSLNHTNLFFSPEFLSDTTARELNDQYLDNGLDPVLKLRAGTPPFQKTFSYHPGLVYERKLQDIRNHHNPLLYSDLLLKEFPDTGDDIPLSSICDSGTLGFKIQYNETLPPVEECSPWMLFDYADTTTVLFTIPGLVVGDPNLRVEGKLLRYNFILRDRTDIGLGEVSYITTVGCAAQQSFQLPSTMPIDSAIYGTVDFPVLPIMKDSTAYADPSDVEVTVDGTSTFLTALDPLTGSLTIDATAQPGSSVEFTYKVQDMRLVEVLDPDRARILDNGFVFGGGCPDLDNIKPSVQDVEYINFLDDYSSGIRKRYFNKTTWQVEELVFSGPVFELCDHSLDELSPPEAYPNALVKIPDGLLTNKTFERPFSFDFADDEIVRFEKRTFKELLPDRSFRTIEVVEMSPI